ACPDADCMAGLPPAGNCDRERVVRRAWLTLGVRSIRSPEGATDGGSKELPEEAFLGLHLFGSARGCGEPPRSFRSNRIRGARAPVASGGVWRDAPRSLVRQSFRADRAVSLQSGGWGRANGLASRNNRGGEPYGCDSGFDDDPAPRCLSGVLGV